MKKFIISGPDGTGKSTIVSALEKYYNYKGLSTRTKWMRFGHLLARGVNLIGRVLGKSYYQEYKWGRVGYHNYQGIIGYVYIYSVFLDYYVFNFFDRLKSAWLPQVDVIIIDRYVLDIMADLIVDTQRVELVMRLFKKIALSKIRNYQYLILACDSFKAKQRRPDLKDDLKYEDKVSAFNYLAQALDVRVLNSGENTVETIIEEIVFEQ